MRLALFLLLAAIAIPAGADLYRWVDPDTGSVKFSSYPPPWFGDAAKERRAPRVEVIPSARPAQAAEPKDALPRPAPERKPAAESKPAAERPVESAAKPAAER